jgi:hypothetical protein
MMSIKLKFVSVLSAVLLATGASRGIALQKAFAEEAQQAEPVVPKAGASREVAPRLDANADPLPEGALFRFGTIRFRHADGINSSALSHDGKLLATTSKSTVVILGIVDGETASHVPRLPCDGRLGQQRRQSSLLPGWEVARPD